MVEDRATKNLLGNRYLTAAIADQGWGGLARARHGGRLIVAERWFASSKTCSACGVVRPKTLAEPASRCDACGLVCDRDVKALHKTFGRSRQFSSYLSPSVRLERGGQR